MTSCDYCDEDAMEPCESCGSGCCPMHTRHAIAGGGIVALCNPDPATWPGRGCHKPPVAEVAGA